MQQDANWIKRKWPWVVAGILVLCAGLLWGIRSGAPETQTYNFTEAESAAYSLSDPAKIEIADDQLQLMSQEGQYATDDPYATTQQPLEYAELSGFSETLGADNQGQVGYQLSEDGREWQYWNGEQWAPAETGNYEQSNNAGIVDDKIDEYGEQSESKNLFVQPILHASTPRTQTSLQSFSVTFEPRAATPTLSGLSPTVGDSAGGTLVTLTGSSFDAIGKYRLPVALTNTGLELTDQQVAITVDTAALVAAGKLRPDGTDLTVVGLDETTALPFWFDPATINTTATKIWVRVPTIPVGSSQITLVYGNSKNTTSAANPATTFDQLTGAKGVWSFDETAGGPIDYSGNGNIMSGASAAVPGKYGNGRSLAGSGSVPHAATVKPTAALTLEAWVKPSTAKLQNIISTMVLSYGYSLELDATLKPIFKLYVGGTLQTVTSPSAIALNGWTHLMATYDGASGAMKLYGNGVELASLVAPGAITEYSSNSLCFGGPAGTTGCGGATFAGTIDEARLYDRALSTAEVSASYSNYSFSNPNYFSNGVVQLAKNLPATSTAALGAETTRDISVTFDGTPAEIISKQSGSLTVVAPPHANSPVDVVVKNLDDTTATLTGAFTYTDLPNGPPSISGLNPIGGNQTGGNKVTISGGNFFSAGTYRRQVAITNPSATTQADYQVQITVDTATPITDGKMKNDGSDIRVLDADGTSLEYWLVPGTINTANTQVWVKVPHLPAGQSRTISFMYGNTANTPKSNSSNTFKRVVGGAQGAWNLDEPSGTTFADASSNAATGTATGTTSVISGVFGNARSLTNAYIWLSSTNVKMPAAFTLESWYRTPNKDVANPIWGTYRIRLDMNNGYCQANLLCLNVNGPAGQVGAPNLAISNNTWYHFVATYDGATQKMYVNGALVASRTTSGAISTDVYAHCIAGAATNSASSCASGSTGATDEPRIYDRALSAAEVSDLYNNYGISTPSQPKTVLVRSRPAATAPSVSIAAEQPYGTTVTFGGIPATFSGTGNQIEAIAPPHESGLVDVVVTNPDGQTFTLAQSYRYAPAPTISGILPERVSSSGGDIITITGSDFIGTPTVVLGGITASQVMLVDDHTLQVVAPPRLPGLVDVTVTNPDGQTHTLAKSLTYLAAAPALYSASPNSGPLNGGQVVNLSGAYFDSSGNYRLPVTLTNSGGALSDHQVQLTLNTAALISSGKMRFDAADLRIVGNDGATPLPFWVDTATVNTANTKIWVRVPAIPSGSSALYLTYGNPSLPSASNANATFVRTIPNTLSYWSYDDATAATVPDLFGSGTSQAVGGGLTTVAGKFSNARNFNGTASAYVRYSSNAYDVTSSVSLETWVNLGAAKAQTLAGTFNYTLSTDSTNKLTFSVSPAGGAKTITAPTVTPSGEWHHVVGTYDSANGQARLYVDGVLIGTQTSSGNLNTGGSYFCLGGVQVSTCNASNLAGLLDETRVYNRALSAAEVTDLASGYAIIFPASPNTMAVTSPPSASLSVSPGSEITQGVSVTFDGAPASITDKLNDSTLRVVAPPHAAGPVTIRVTNPDGQYAELAGGFTYSSQTVRVDTVTPPTGGAAGGTNVAIAGSGFFNQGKWRSPITLTSAWPAIQNDYQVMLTFDMAALVASGRMKSDGSDIRILDSNGASLPYWISPNTINTAATEIWVRVPYIAANASRTLSLVYGDPAATAQSSNTATFRQVVTGAQGIWHMDETSGTSVVDNSGNAFNGSAVGAAIAQGRFNNGRSFSGSQYISIATNAALRPTAAVSMEAWFKTTDTAAAQGIFSGLYSTSSGMGLTLNIAGDTGCNTSLCFQVGVGGGLRAAGVPSSSLQRDTWYHAVGTYDGSNVRLYLNGTEVAAKAQTGAINHAGYPLCIGNVGSTTCSTGNYFKGTIDEVRVYDRAVTAAEASSLYAGYGFRMPVAPRQVYVRTVPVANISMTAGASEAFSGSVTFDDRLATGVSGNNTLLSAITPAHPLGLADVTVTNPDGSFGTLTDSYKYAVYGYKFMSPPLELREGQPGQLIIQPIDEFGNPVITTEDITINLATSSSTGFFARDLNEDPSTQWTYASVILPAGASQVIAYYKDNAKGTPTITANGPPADGSLAATQNARIMSKYRLLVTGVTAPVQSGIPSSVTVQAVDYDGQPLTDYTGTIRFSSGDGTAVVPSDFTFTADMLGSHTFTNGVTLVSQGDWCLTAADVSDPDIAGSQCSIDVTPPNSGSPAKVRFITPPQILSRGVASGVVTIQLQDADNLPAPAAANTAIYLYSASSTGEFSADGVSWQSSGQPLTVRAGTTSLNFYYRDATSGVHTLTARDDQGTGQDFGLENGTQDVDVGAGPAFKLAIQPPVAPLAVGEVSGAFQVRLQDESGNPAIAVSDTPVWLSVPGATARLGSSSTFSGSETNTLQVIIPAGATSATFYHYDTNAGQRLIAASDSSPPNGDVGLVDAAQSVTVGSGAPVAIAFTSQPQQVVAGAVSGALTIQLVDEHGNPATAASDTTLYVSSDKTGTEFLAADGVTPTSQLVIAAGQSSASFTFKQTSFAVLPTITVSDATPADGTAGLDDASQQQLITTGTAAKLAITSSAPPASPAGTANGPIVVTLQNQHGVNVPANGDITLYVTSSSVGGSFSLTNSPWAPAATLTLPNGQDHLDVYYQDTLAGTATITIADEASGSDVALTNATQTIQTLAGPAGKLQITSAPKTLQAGQGSSGITLRLADQYGNPVVAASDITVTLTSTSAEGRFDRISGGDYDGSITTVIIPAGQSSVNFYYKDMVAGSPVITASADDLTEATQTETINWGAITKLTFTNPGPIIAGESSQPIEVTALNGYNVPVELATDLVVTLGSTGTTGRFDSASGGAFDGSVTSVVIPAGQSKTTFYYKNTKAGNHTINGQAGGATGSRGVTIVAAAPTKLVFTTPEQNLEIGARSNAYTLQLRDEFDNPSAAPADVPITPATTSPTGRFVTSSQQPLPSFKITAGNNSSNFYYIDSTIGTQIITVTASGLTGADQTVTLEYGDPARFSLTSPSTTISAGQTVQMTVYVANSSGEAIPAPADITVNLTSNSSGGRFDAASDGEFDGSFTSVVIPAGSTNAVFYYQDIDTGNPTVLAQQTGYSQGSYTFNIGAATVYQLGFTNVPRTTVAGKTSGSHVVRLQDQFGNVLSATSARTITIHDEETSAQLSRNTSTFTSGDLQLNMAVGQQSVSFYYRDTVAGQKILTASSSGLQDGTQQTTVVPDVFHHIGFTTPEQTIAAQTPSGPITLTGYDQYDNQRSMLVGAPPLRLGLESGSTGGEFSLDGADWQPITELSIPNGTNEATFYYKDSVLGSTLLTVDDPGNIVAPITQPITVTAGPLAGLHFSSPPQTVVHDTPSAPFTLELVDQFGYQTVSDQPVDVAVTSDSVSGEFSLDGVTWTSSITITYQPGQAEASFFYRDSAEGGHIIEASSTGLFKASQVVAIVPGEIAKLSLDVATPVTAGQPTAVRVQTQTADSLLAAVASPAVISLASNTGGEFSLSDTNWQPIAEVTIPAGQYEVNLFYRNTTAGNDTIQANPPTDTTWESATFDITVGAADFTTFGFQVMPVTVPAGEASSAIVVTARDQFGNVVLPNQEQTVYLYGPATGEFATNPGGPWTVGNVTMPAGSGTATFYYRDTLPGVDKTLTASDQTPLDEPDSGIVNAVGTLSIASLPPSKVAVQYDGPEPVNAGELSGPVVITALQPDDSDAVLGQNLVIDLTSDSPSGQYFATNDINAPPITQATIPAGKSQVTVFFSSQKSGDIGLTAASSGLENGTATITFASTAPTQLQFMTSPQVKAAGEDSEQIRVQLQDEFGNPATTAQNVDIDLTTSSPTGEFSLLPGDDWSAVTSLELPAGASDLYFYHRDTVIGLWHLEASTTDFGDRFVAEQTFSVLAGTAAKLVFTTPEPNLEAGQVSGAQVVTVTDAFGNVTTASVDIPLYLGSTSAGGQFSASSDFTDTTPIILGTGQQSVSFFYKDTQVGNPTLTASDLPLPDSPDQGLVNATQQATIIAGEPVKLALTGQPTQVAGAYAAFTLAAQNQYGVPVPVAQDVTITLAGGSGQFSLTSPGSAVSEVTIPAGGSSLTVYYRDTTPGQRTLTAADSGLASATANVTILPADLARLRFITPSPELEAGEASGLLSVQAQDALGNAVTMPVDLTINLGSTSLEGRFSADNTFGSMITQITIPAGGSVATFYYRDTTPGNPVITASDLPLPDSPDQGLVNAILNASITPGAITKLGWSGFPADVTAGPAIGPITVSAQNQYGVALPVSSDLTIQLAHSAARSGFSTSPSGPWDLTSVVIPSGESQVQLYYRALDPGQDTIVAADNDPAGPDANLTDATQTLQAETGAASSIVLTNQAYTITARHTSPVYTAELRNEFGGAVPAAVDTRLYLRSTSGGGEFAASPTGPWGINFVTIPAGQSGKSFYYRDSNVGTPTITVADNLPPTPDAALTNATQTQTIEQQIIHHFLVTNITTPQTQGTPSSVVVIAQDSENYVISDYSGTIHFTSNDGGATLPADYTFVPSKDKGIHTFVNAIAFPTSGVKTVTATDQDGISGSQINIIVNDNPAGPITGLHFRDVPDPLQIPRRAASPPLTIEARDSQGRPSNAPVGGFPIHLTSDSTGGEFATSPGGPWATTLDTSIPAGFSSVAIYYRDSVLGTPSITASDWFDSRDDPGLSNASLDAEIVQSDFFTVTAPASAKAGEQFNVTINAVDSQGTLLTDYTGDKQVEFSGAGNAPNGQAPAYPTTVHFEAGVATAVITLYNAETLRLTALEDVISGESGDITVVAADAVALTATAPASVRAGEAFTVTLQAYDQFGNVATGFDGSQNLVWSGATNAPDGTAPQYPSTANFTNGTASVQVTLFNREVVSLQVTTGSLQDDTELITVVSADATTIAAVSGDNQRTPVSQPLPQPIVVVVTDTYGNPVSSHTVDFVVTAGDGSLSVASATTGLNGTAQVNWTVGPAAGTNNNVMEAQSSGLSGSPVTFTASATANGFAITTPNTVTAGEPFTIQIKLVDENGNTITNYNGTKTLQFSGPSDGLGGQTPTYPVEVTFVDGVAQPDPQITLVAAETTHLTATEGEFTGTSLPFTVRAGLTARLDIISPPQQVFTGDASRPIAVCVQDAFGNVATAIQDRTITMTSTSASGEFAATPDGPWGTPATILAGSSCVDVYYRDTAPGTFTLSFESEGLVGQTQEILVLTKPTTTEPQPSPQPSPAQTITVYADSPTLPVASLALPLPTIDVPLPTVTFPIILAPANNTIVTPLSGDIIVSGIGPPSQTVRLLGEGASSLASTTSDASGRWVVHVARNKFTSNKQAIYAELANGARSSTVTFTIKAETLTERIERWWSQ